MAIYHMSAQMVKRSEGRNAIAMSAYRSGQSLLDEATELVKDYTAKTKVFLAEILAPQDAPAWMQDRQSLWNGVERKENRKDAQLAREINIALPKELSLSQKQKLARKYVQDNFVSKGMVADVAYHDLDTDNPHFHIMLTTRTITKDGFGKKERSWNHKDLLKKWRESWSKHANFALQKAGFTERIDHRSLEAQGIKREPQIHVGNSGKGKNGSVRSRRNEAIIARNLEKSRLKLDLIKITSDIRKLDNPVVHPVEEKGFLQRMKEKLLRSPLPPAVVVERPPKEAPKKAVLEKKEEEPSPQPESEVVERLRAYREAKQDDLKEERLKRIEEQEQRRSKGTGTDLSWLSGSKPSPKPKPKPTPSPSPSPSPRTDLDDDDGLRMR